MLDIEAIITFLKSEDGGRKMPVFSGYRPAHLVKDDYPTTGAHQYYNKEKVQPGESVIGSITFITPEYYPHCLWVGKLINIQEGGRIVGYALIVKIFNELLKVKD